MNNFTPKLTQPKFANINFMGNCNLNCYFCLGNELKNDSSLKDTNGTHFSCFQNLEEFKNLCFNKKIFKLYFTGLNTDPLMYKYLEKFYRSLRNDGFSVGIRTNGILALKHMELINSLQNVSYTLFSLNPKTMQLMTGSKLIPHWINIFNFTQKDYRVTIPVTRHNESEIFKLINFCSSFKQKPDYIQLTKINRKKGYYKYEEDLIAFNNIKTELTKHHLLVNSIQGREVFRINGLKVILWDIFNNDVEGINYFTNGRIIMNNYIINSYTKSFIPEEYNEKINF